MTTNTFGRALHYFYFIFFLPEIFFPVFCSIYLPKLSDFPAPVEEKQPHGVTLLPPFFTIGMVCPLICWRPRTIYRSHMTGTTWLVLNCQRDLLSCNKWLSACHSNSKGHLCLLPRWSAQVVLSINSPA